VGRSHQVRLSALEALLDRGWIALDEVLQLAADSRVDIDEAVTLAREAGIDVVDPVTRGRICTDWRLQGRRIPSCS
jgi:hypothetical protein